MNIAEERQNFISVVVPVYNVDAYLEDCLDSLVSQTVSFKEIILVNDGSTDSSREICDKYCKKNRNMYLINQINQGLSAARNAGLKYVKGDYIVFIDPDDYVTPDMNESIQIILETKDLDILYYNADVINEIGEEGDDRPIVRSDKLNGYTMSGMEFLEKSFPDDYNASACMAVFSKSFLEEYHICFPFGLYYEDNIFFIQTVMRAKKVFCVPNRFYIRRLRKNSIMTGAMSRKKCVDHIKVYILIWEELYNYEYKDIYRNFYKNFLSIRIRMTFDLVKNYMNDEMVCKDLREMAEIFMQKWFFLYESASLDWDDACALQLISRFLSDTGNDKDNRSKCYQLNKEIERMLVKRLERLPLSCHGKKVGIYGTGKHTSILLEVFEHYIGRIHCNLFFVETENKKDTFMGRKVVYCDEIPNDAYVIISSWIYREGMFETLLKNNIKEDRIITIYDKHSSNGNNLIRLVESKCLEYKAN